MCLWRRIDLCSDEEEEEQQQEAYPGSDPEDSLIGDDEEEDEEEYDDDSGLLADPAPAASPCAPQHAWIVLDRVKLEQMQASKRLLPSPSELLYSSFGPECTACTWPYITCASNPTSVVCLAVV